MEIKTNNRSAEVVGDAADRPFCVFYVDPATPKAIQADTVMATSDDAARDLTREKHKECMILYVRGVGTEDDATASVDPDRASNHQLPPLESLPGARFIDGEFRATQDSDQAELDAISE